MKIKQFLARPQHSAYAIIMVAFAVRLYNLPAVPLTRDEAHTIQNFAALPLLDIFTTLNSNNHPLASALAHVASPQADHLFMMRWTAIVTAMVALPFVYRLATDLFGAQVGLLAVLLVGASYIHIGYAGTVRGYAGLMTISVILLYFLQRALRHNRWRDWVGFAASANVGIFFHLFVMPAAWSLLGLTLVGVSLGYYRRAAMPHRWPAVGVRFLSVLGLIAVVHGPMTYQHTSAVIDEGGYAADFNVWFDGLNDWREDMIPITHFARLMAPMSPGNVAAYLFGAFFVGGLLHLSRSRPLMAGLVGGWFVAPFVGALVGMYILGESFYVYTRFLLYLLPAYLIVVSLGMVSVADWLSRHGVAGRVMVITGVGVLLVGLSMSVVWYKQASTYANWQKVASVLQNQLRPEDIIICDEPQGFDVSDRAKAYCVWMLDYLVDGVTQYTFRLSSSTNDSVNFDQLQAHRPALLNRGRVWLVRWERLLVFYPDYLPTDQPPPMPDPLPSGVLRGYEYWPAGAATLIRVDTGDSLLQNLEHTLNLQIQLTPHTADKARYYRSLAELYAFRGQKPQAETAYQASWAMVEQTGGEYPQLFLLDTKPLIERIPPTHTSQQMVRHGYHFEPALCLQSYHVYPEYLHPGQPLTLTLSWYTHDFIPHDYTFYLSLAAHNSDARLALNFAPFDRTYPTPWWWPGQRLVDERAFTLPADLPLVDYTVHLGADGFPLETPLFTMTYQSEQATWTINTIEVSTACQ